MKLFISYTSSDREWAHWIGWQLQSAGHQAFVHEWEIGAGQNIPRWMEERAKEADRLIGVFSDAYCKALYSQSERWAAYWNDPDGRTGFLVPVEVRKVTEWPTFVKPLRRLSLVDRDESEALRDLLEFLETPKPPVEKPMFPGGVRTAEPAPPLFTVGSESLGGLPPTFPTAQPATNGPEAVVPRLASAVDPDATIRCIDDFEPRPVLFGRDDEIETVVSALLTGKPALIAGGPGMGKTALATAAIRDPRVESHFGRRRVFASLEAATEPRAILAKLVETFGLPPTGDDVSLLRIIEANAAERPIAAILDNTETVFEVDRGRAERLLNLVAQVKGLSLAVTIRGVAPPIPGAILIDDLPKLASEPARLAFLAVAGAAFHADSNLVHLLEALDGHALSISLVAAQAIGLPSLEGIRESWDDAHAEILRRPGEEESRLTSVRASLALSLNSRRMKSTPLARRLMAILAFLPAGLGEADVRHLLGERGMVTAAKANEAIACLHQLRLVERRFDRRLRMLTPLRECAKSDVAPLEVDRKRLIAHYLSLAAKAEKAGKVGWESTHEQIESESDNLDPICELAITTNTAHKHLYAALFGLAELHRFSGRATVQSLGVAAGRLRGTALTGIAVLCARKLGDIAVSHSDHEAARDRFDQALQLSRQIGAVEEEARCLLGLCKIAIQRSAYSTASDLNQDALALFRKINNVQGEGHCILHFGQIAFHCDNRETARAQFEEAATLYRSIGAAGDEANCISSLGQIALTRSDYETARERFEEALALHRRVGAMGNEANCIRSLGNMAFMRSDYETAHAHFAVALAVFRRIGAVLGEAACIESFGEIARARSNHETARAQFEEALALFRRIGAVSGEADCVLSLGQIARARSDREMARARFEEALTLYRSIGAVIGEAETMIRQGQLRRTADEAQGLADIEAGFALYLTISDSEDRALAGWQAMRIALTCCDAAEAEKHRELARSEWTAIGRLDLVRDWADESF